MTYPRTNERHCVVIRFYANVNAPIKSSNSGTLSSVIPHILCMKYECLTEDLIPIYGSPVNP